MTNQTNEATETIDFDIDKIPDKFPITPTLAKYLAETDEEIAMYFILQKHARDAWVAEMKKPGSDYRRARAEVADLKAKIARKDQLTALLQRSLGKAAAAPGA